MIRTTSLVREALLVLFAVVTAVASAQSQCTPQWAPGELPGTNEAVRATLQWDPDGTGPLPLHTVLGGDFTAAGSLVVDHIAMRNPITGAWSALGAGLQGGSVQALAVSANGELVAGGRFTSSGGGAVARIARWTGTAWAPLGSGMDAPVRSIAFAPNGDLVAGGDFTTAGGNPAQHVARWNGSSWSALGTGVSGPFSYVAEVLALANGDIIVGGNFLTAGGVAAGAIARWDGAAWSSLGAGFSGLVGFALLPLANGDLVAGFGNTNSIQRWDGTNWTPFASFPNLLVRDLALLPGGEILAAGQQFFNGGTPVGSIGVWDGSAWSGFGSPNGAVYSLMVTPSGLIAGGEFNAIGSLGAANVAEWNATGGWQALGGGFGQPVQTVVATPDGGVVAGGDFTTVQGIPAGRVARFDGTTWTPLGAGVNGTVYSLAVLPNGNVVAGGSFSNAGGIAANGVAQWNGATWQPMGAGFGGPAHAMALLPNGDLVAAGVSLTSVAVWDGLTWTPLAGLSGVWAVAVLADGSIVAGGDFFGNVARWNGSSWDLLGTGLDGSVREILPLPNGDLIAGGYFTTAGSVAANRVARWDGTAWSALGSGPFSGVHGLAALPDGSIAAAGYEYVASMPASRLSRWDGSSWHSIGDGVSGGGFSVAEALAVRTSGELVVGGWFLFAGGAPSAYLARWATPCPAEVQVNGVGCTGSGGPNQLMASTTPWVGSTFTSRATGMPAQGLAVAVFGLGTLNTPLSTLLPQGSPGCDLLVTPDLLSTLLLNAGSVDVTFAIPNSPALAAQSFGQQVVAVEISPASIVALTSTNALAVTIGSY